MEIQYIDGKDVSLTYDTIYGRDMIVYIHNMDENLDALVPFTRILDMDYDKKKRKLYIVTADFPEPKRILFYDVDGKLGKDIFKLWQKHNVMHGGADVTNLYVV